MTTGRVPPTNTDRVGLTVTAKWKRRLSRNHATGPCHMWTPPVGKGFYKRSCKTVGCSHMSGLCARLLWPLALMISAE
jgi:hypothetical protein